MAKDNFQRLGVEEKSLLATGMTGQNSLSANLWMKLNLEEEIDMLNNRAGQAEAHKVQQSKVEGPKTGMKYTRAVVLSGANWIEISVAEEKKKKQNRNRGVTS